MVRPGVANPAEIRAGEEQADILTLHYCLVHPACLGGKDAQWAILKIGTGNSWDSVSRAHAHTQGCQGHALATRCI